MSLSKEQSFSNLEVLRNNAGHRKEDANYA